MRGRTRKETGGAKPWLKSQQVIASQETSSTTRSSTQDGNKAESASHMRKRSLKTAGTKKTAEIAADQVRLEQLRELIAEQQLLESELSKKLARGTKKKEKKKKKKSRESSSVEPQSVSQVSDATTAAAAAAAAIVKNAITSSMSSSSSAASKSSTTVPTKTGSKSRSGSESDQDKKKKTSKEKKAKKTKSSKKKRHEEDESNKESGNPEASSSSQTTKKRGFEDVSTEEADRTGENEEENGQGPQKRIKLDARQVYDQLQQSTDNAPDRLVDYRHPDQLPSEMQKYWSQRFRYFTLYNQGIKMDKEGWYSVTPEVIAVHIAHRCASDVIIDAFCGVGGNAIQFALTCHRVIAIDIDPVRLMCARHNAKIYGVEDRIEFICGDYMTLIPRLKADVVFLSPPWGGPGYKEQNVFDIKRDIPMNGEVLFRETSKITHNIAYYLPRNSNVEQIGRLAEPNGTCEVEKNNLNNVCKAWTAYFGDLAMVPLSDMDKSRDQPHDGQAARRRRGPEEDQDQDQDASEYSEADNEDY